MELWHHHHIHLLAVHFVMLSSSPDSACCCLRLQDNWRVMHGREPYTDLSRQLWRVWCWTTRASGVPAEAVLDAVDRPLSV